MEGCVFVLFAVPGRMPQTNQTLINPCEVKFDQRNSEI